MQNNDPNQRTNDTSDHRQTQKMDSSSISPTLLIFGAWLAGTLLFEISALDDAGSQTATEHWGNRKTAMEKWIAQETVPVVALTNISRQPFGPKLSDRSGR